MLDSIKQCKRCKLCNNQDPLLDKPRNCDIMWVGLSAKKVDDIENDIPLSNKTNTGRIVEEIESRCNNVLTYKTNLVKCLPLDENEKLRYPNSSEMNICFNNLIKEIDILNPKIIFLLGSKVTIAVERNLKIKFEKNINSYFKIGKYKGIELISVYHPSYIHSYRRKYKDSYIEQISNTINTRIKNRRCFFIDD